ncbi:MAG: hypothetical protein WA159_09605 [Variovorax sp.]
MNPSLIRKLSAFAVVVALAGCAATAVTSDALQKNTAFALGVDSSAFTISDRVDEGVKTTYRVATRSGKTYSCYVTGAISITGRNVSDAICTEMGKPAGATAGPAGRSTNPANCNALLKAAGRC